MGLYRGDLLASRASFACVSVTETLEVVVSVTGTDVTVTLDVDVSVTGALVTETLDVDVSFAGAPVTETLELDVEVSFSGALMQPATNSKTRAATIMTTKLVYFISFPLRVVVTILNEKRFGELFRPSLELYRSL